MRTIVLAFAILAASSCFAKCTKETMGNVTYKNCTQKDGSVKVTTRTNLTFEQKVAALNAVNGMYHPAPIQVPAPYQMPVAPPTPPVHCTTTYIGDTAYTTCN
jgi:hypothetical protein